MFVGYLGDQPVVTGLLVLYGNVAGIYDIATIPQHRKKGFATAMMRHLLSLAQATGYLIAVLQAPHDGLSIYEKLGFKGCCHFCRYASEIIL
jgi:ribosomal protein S18 acetylase RimI-like enzyme